MLHDHNSITQDDQQAQEIYRDQSQKRFEKLDERQQLESPVTCLEGDRPNEERIQATGKHVAGLPQHNRYESTFLLPQFVIQSGP